MSHVEAKDWAIHFIKHLLCSSWASLVAQMVKNISAMPETWVEMTPGGEHGNPVQYSCLENLMDRGAGGYSPWGHKESDKTDVTEQAKAIYSYLKFLVSIMLLLLLLSRFSRVRLCATP